MSQRGYCVICVFVSRKRQNCNGSVGKLDEGVPVMACPWVPGYSVRGCNVAYMEYLLVCYLQDGAFWYFCWCKGQTCLGDWRRSKARVIYSIDLKILITNGKCFSLPSRIHALGFYWEELEKSTPKGKRIFWL